MQLILDIIEKVSQLTDFKNVEKSKTQFLAEKCLSELTAAQKKTKNDFIAENELIQKKIHEIVE